MRSPSLLTIKRMNQLGRLGEVLAGEGLRRCGFSDVQDLNIRQMNYPFADIVATRSGARFLIGVKTRNEMREGDVGLNGSYNLVLVSNSAKALLEGQGKTKDQITALLLNEINELAATHEAVAGWVTVSVRPRTASYSAYFGLVSSLGNKRSVPTTHKARTSYLCLADNLQDNRITLDLLNVVAG
jgi:hypothetical protein